jgi:citrate lyase ligase-like protein
MAKIGLVPMSAKPFTAGHDGLVRIACKENDEVHLYVSLSDRDNISGGAMAKVWKELIEPTLPANVKVTYGGSPVGNVYKELGEANEAGSQDIFSVYSDPTDLGRNFKSLERYAGNLTQAGQIILRGIERSSTVEVSGTEMRGYLASGNKDAFVSKLPTGLDGDKVWHVLRTLMPAKTAKAAGPQKKAAAKPKAEEALLRGYVRLLVGR